MPKVTQTSPYPASWDVPPLISISSFPIENSLGRRGASSRLRFAKRQSHTVLHRLTGHLGRRGQGSMKTNNVSPVFTPTSPSCDAEAPCYCLPVSLSLVSFQRLVPLSAHFSCPTLLYPMSPLISFHPHLPCFFVIDITLLRSCHKPGLLHQLYHLPLWLIGLPYGG